MNKGFDEMTTVLECGKVYSLKEGSASETAEIIDIRVLYYGGSLDHDVIVVYKLDKGAIFSTNPKMFMTLVDKELADK
tara:strand:- start:513 stop:746 length:234 start_codon:yes stop_codon:yes gene_type:complete